MRSFKKILKDFIVPVLVAGILAVLINKFIVFKIYIPSGSMIPTLMPGDQLFVTCTYNTDNLKRGDIIVFYSQERKELLIKRLIGLPGEKVDVDAEGNVFINSKKLNEPYVFNTSDKTGSFQVPKNHFLFLGDNRSDSLDSRYWNNPYISKDDIKGKARIIVFPFNRFGLAK